MGLTTRQRECLEIIEAHLALHGFPPTIREIGAAMGGIQTHAVAYHLDALERKKHIRVTDTAARGIRVLRSATDIARVEAPAIIVCAMCGHHWCWMRREPCPLAAPGMRGRFGVVVAPASASERATVTP